MDRFGSLVIIGSGPGIGSHVAARFAAAGFTNIALMARRSEQLEQDKQLVLSNAPEGTRVEVYSVDITQLDVLATTLSKISSELGAPECVYYNAALVRPSLPLALSEDDMLEDYKVSCTSLHATAKWAIPHLLELVGNSDAKPALLITSSLLPQEPSMAHFSLSMVKAAQFNLAQSLSMMYGKEGVHIGLVVVAGVVSPDHKTSNPKNIADKAWELFDQPRDTQTFVTEILE